MLFSKRRRPLTLLAAPLFTLAACGGGGGGTTTSGGSAGELVLNAATGLYVVIEENNGGAGTSLSFVDEPVWGRLVDVVATDPGTMTPRTYLRDLLVGEDVETGAEYTLSRNAATGRDVLTIPQIFGTPAFEGVFRRLDDGLQRFLDKGLGANELPPFTSMPRNAAMALRFGDLLNEDSVSEATVLLEVGYPPSAPFEARIFPDPNHGDFVGSEFHSSWILIDMSISQAEGQATGIPSNAAGLPEAVEAKQPNVVVRIPTILNAGATQFQLLTNRSGHGMSFGGNGSTLSSSPTLDVVRAFRSGGRTITTGDPFNGFLRDNEPPAVLAALGVTVTFVAPVGSEFDVDLTYETANCALTPRVGDLLVLPGGVTAEVTLPGNPPGAFGAVSNVRCALLSGNAAQFAPGVGQYRSPWDASVPVVAECFVRFSPEPLTGPSSGVAHDASIQIAFTEPMSPDALNAFDGIAVQKGNGGALTYLNNVLGVVTSALDLQEFTLDPLVELDHDQGSQESYTVELLAGVSDLAGNPLATPLPRTTFSVSSASPTVNSGQFAFTFSNGVTGFSSGNVDDSGDGLPELRGQFIFDPVRGELRPRSVDRFSGVIDLDRCNVSAMWVPATVTLTSGGTFALPEFGTLPPLSPHGSRTMTAWRYFDMGLSLFDEGTYNIDVEGLSWALFSQGLALDFFTQFQIALAHSLVLPDESVTVSTGGVGGPTITVYPNSGLSSVFDANLLDPTNDPLTVVHERTRGYLVQPLDQFTTASGQRMAPWPLNRNQPLSSFHYYTYRDTALTGVGAPSSSGADPDSIALCPESFVFQSAAGASPPDWINANAPSYNADAVPSIGLPLLIDFRAYPDSNAQGLNLLRYRFATNTLLTVAFPGVLPLTPLTPPALQPVARIHSTGGQMPNGSIVQVNPDQQISATGSFDITGAPTPGPDAGFYLGQADFVVRVNRVHTIWLDSGPGALSTWEPALFLPGGLEQPSGTQVSVAYRGAVLVTLQGGGNINSVINSANFYDPYGNAAGSKKLIVIFLNGDDTWKDDVNDVDGARFLQMRITMVSNVESDVEPVLTALGVSYSN